VVAASEYALQIGMGFLNEGKGPRRMLRVTHGVFRFDNATEREAQLHVCP
jgi:hypothetical protein